MKEFWSNLPPKVKATFIAFAAAVVSAVLTRLGVQTPEFDIVGKAMGY